MLVSGNEEKDIEKYTGNAPSPNPDYPQEIKTIEDSLKVISCGKNILNITTVTGYEFGYGIPTNLTSYIVVDSFDSNNITYHSTVAYYLEVLTNIIQLKPNTTYTLSFDRIGTSTNNQTFIYDYNNGIYTINYRDNNTNQYKITFTTGPNGQIVLGFGYGNAIGTTTISNIQLEESSTATSFEQHLETQITANLPEGEFIGKINDTYKDTLKVEYNEEDGQYHLVLNKNVGKVMLDGSENWKKGNDDQQTSNTNLFYLDNRIIIPKIKGITNILSDKLLTKDVVGAINDFVGICGSVGLDHIIYIRINQQLTLEEFKNWLSTHNTEVYYALETPYILDLGIVDMPITYNEVTNVFTDSDLMPQINAKYYRNFISTVRNLQVNEKALKQELIDINNRLSSLESASASVMSESEVVE